MVFVPPVPSTPLQAGGALAKGSQGSPASVAANEREVRAAPVADGRVGDVPGNTPRTLPKFNPQSPTSSPSSSAAGIRGACPQSSP